MKHLLPHLISLAAIITHSLVEAGVSYGHSYYESIPSRFGMDWQPPTQTHLAHLQFLQERPRLCDETFELDVIAPNDTLPVALLVERGNCTFEQKAMVAMKAYPTVRFMIVYDHTPEKRYVSMTETTDAEDIKLGMLFVSNEAGIGRYTPIYFPFSLDNHLFLT